jgi:hypothetical protein
VYAAIRRYKTTPGSNPEIARVATEGYLPLISKVPGFVAYYGLEAANDEYVAVAIFEDRAGAEESTRATADFIRENLAPLLPTSPDVTEGTIIVYQAGGVTSGAPPETEEVPPMEQERYTQTDRAQEEGRRLVYEATDKLFDRFLGGRRDQVTEEPKRREPPRGDEPPR